MGEITWKNVEGPSPAAGLAALGAAAETLDKGFQPLHQIIKDHEAQAAQHWDAQKAINTRDMLAKIQSTQDLGELNEARDSGRLNESAMVDRFGAQIDTAGMNSAIMNQRDILRNRLQKELISEGLAAADASEDLAVGAKNLRDSILARGGHVDFAQTAAGQFMEGNKDRANLYAKAKQDRLSSELAAIDPKSLNGFADVSALVREMAKSGKKVNLAAFAEGAEKILANNWAEENRRISAEDRKDKKAHEALMLQLQLEDRNHTRALEQKAVEDAALAKRLAYNDKLYAEFAGQGADFITKERAALAGATGFAPEHLKYMESVALKGADPFEGFNKDAPDLTRDMINKAVSQLMNGKISSGPDAGKRFNFSEKDAKVITGLAVKAMQGSEDGKHTVPWLGNTAEGGLTKLIQDIAPRYRKFKNDSAALDKVAASFAERGRAFQSWRAGIDAEIPNVKAPTLYPIESDPVVAEYMKRRLSNAPPADKSAGTNAGGGIGNGGPLARTFMNKFTKGENGFLRTKSPSGLLRPITKSEYTKYVRAQDTMKEVGKIETELKKQLRLRANPGASPRFHSDPHFEKKLARDIEANKKRLKELYRKSF